MGTFSIFDHTADVGLSVEAGSFEELLETAARGVFSVALEDQPQEVSRELEVRVKTPPDLNTNEDLLVAWLQELLYHFETERLVPLTFKFRERGPRGLVVRVGFGEFDPAEHRTGPEVKAVTYHDLEVCERSKHDWCARVILDI
jgi:SHS2 domain-containing protein